VWKLDNRFLFQIFSYNCRFVWRSIVMQQPGTTETSCWSAVFEIFLLFMKDNAFLKLEIYRFTLCCGNLNSRKKYIYDFFHAHGAFCYARSLTSFGCPYFIMYKSLGLIKVNPRLIASDDICEWSIVVFRELFQQSFGDSCRSKFLLFCKEMRYLSGTYPSHL
jgi:hypothetical protein